MLKKFVFVVGCCLVTYGTATASTLSVRDSIGVRSVKGKSFIAHKVEPKETLYALSRKYGVTVAQIVEANNNIQKSISIGQIVLVPMLGENSATATAKASRQPKAAPNPEPPQEATASTPSASGPAANRTYSVDEKGNKMHQVQPNQTLFSISKLHGVSVDQIKAWNSLPGNNIEIGKSLIVGVGAKGSTQGAAASQIYVPERDDAMASKENASNAPATPSAPAAAPVTTVSVKADDAEDKTSKTPEYVARVSESGMAELIDQKSDANKFLALHKTAPVGTIMAVKNPMNDQTVYVRVIGKLPSTGDNDKLVVKLSKKACQQIGVSDKRFRVELSYMP